MYSGKVVKSFKCKLTQKVYRPGAVYRHEDKDRLNKLAELGYVEFPEARDNNGKRSPRIKHIGGGWYELPNGEKVQGKDEALEALQGE